MFKKQIENRKEEMLAELCHLITFPSISEFDPDNASAPFGNPCKEALDYFLELASRLGFRTKNIDGYCGYAEFGQGEELVGIIGHLDVVPAITEDWNYAPFQATIQNGMLYGRGAIDDKGPVIAALYAMKAVYDTIKVQKRVRLIVGLNEERDWKCIKRYKETEEIPSIGFSPDADFPCIYAEKGIVTVYLKQDYTNHQTDNIRIKSIDCGNNAINVVPKICSVILKINTDKIQMENFLNVIKEIIEKYKYEIDIYRSSDAHVKLTSHGVAAHSAHPDLGVNAISKLLVVLRDLFATYYMKLDLIDGFCQYIGDDYTGRKLGINYQDESGSLTLNTSQFALDNGTLSIGMNLRIPVNTSISSIANRFQQAFQEKKEIDLTFEDRKEPLWIEKDSPLVQTLCSIFHEETKRSDSPVAIGGATYARAFPNCISFGANMPGHTDMCHQADEYIKIDHLMQATNIYAKAIATLAN